MEYEKFFLTQQEQYVNEIPKKEKKAEKTLDEKMHDVKTRKLNTNFMGIF